MARFASALLILSFLVAGPASAQKTLSASNAWIKAPAAGGTTALGFVVVDNPTMYDVYLVSAQSDVAASVTFQKPGVAGAKAEAVENVTAPAYDSLELKPDGVHLLFSGLKKPLNPGDQVKLLLTTDGGVVLEVSAEVRKN